MEVVLGGLVGGPGGIPVEALHKVCLEVQGDPGVLGNLPGHLALVQGKAASTSRLKTDKIRIFVSQSLPATTLVCGRRPNRR